MLAEIPLPSLEVEHLKVPETPRLVLGLGRRDSAEATDVVELRVDVGNDHGYRIWAGDNPRVTFAEKSGEPLLGAPADRRPGRQLLARLKGLGRLSPVTWIRNVKHQVKPDMRGRCMSGCG